MRRPETWIAVPRHVGIILMDRAGLGLQRLAVLAIRR
jgi:hypothetical protein